jgi:hypothetical protein
LLLKNELILREDPILKLPHDRPIFHYHDDRIVA